jgi:hypothetical protein
VNELGNFLPTLLASAFGGGVVAGAFGIYNRVASKNDEHEKWLRDQKAAAYSAYLNAAQALVVAVSGYRGGQVTKDDTFNAFSAAQLGALELLAPPIVREAAQELEEACDRIFHQVVYTSLLADRPAFLAAIDLYNAKKRTLLSLAQDDLSISHLEYPAGGSKLGDEPLVD